MLKELDTRSEKLDSPLLVLHIIFNVECEICKCRGPVLIIPLSHLAIITTILKKHFEDKGLRNCEISCNKTDILNVSKLTVFALNALLV